MAGGAAAAAVHVAANVRLDQRSGLAWRIRSALCNQWSNAPDEWIIFALIALIGGGFVQATVWSALGEKNPWTRLSCFALLAFGLAFILTLAATAGSPAAILIAMVFSGMVYATGGALMIFRANGFRYVRARNRIR